MTKNEANEIIDACSVRLRVMKHHYEKTREFVLDSIEQANLEQINELLSDIQSGLDKGAFVDMEVRCIQEDTVQLWEELSPIMG